MKSAMKTVRTRDGRTLLIVGNRRKQTSEAEMLQRVADEAGVPVDAPAYARPIGAARGEHLAEAEKARIMSEALRRGGVGGDLKGLMAGKESDEPASGEAWDWRTDLPVEEDDERKAETARRHREELAAKTYSVLTPVSRIVYAKIVAALANNAGVEARIARGQNLLIVVRSPAQDWDARVGETMRSWLSRQAVDRDGAIEQTCYVCDESDRRYVDYASTIVRLQNSHVVLVARSEGAIPAGLLPVVDATVRLAEIEFSDFQTAMRGRFPDAEIDALVEPADFALTSLGAEFLDGAILRAGTASEVVALANEMAGLAAFATDGKADEKRTPLSSRSVAATEVLRPTAPKLENLHGYGAAAAWAADLVRDLADYRSGKLTWSDVDAGCLLVGPPGTGKTMFASALAASAGLPFVSTSYADWQSQGDGHLGYVLKTLRQRFADTSSHAPAILFIDEIDAVGRRGGRRDDGWWTAIVTALLEALDGTTRREGLVVIAACNDAASLDPALVRSGRLDRRFTIDLPDEQALASIFAHHLPNGDPAAFATAATVLAGSTSGADVQKIAREARRAARRAGREVEADDLLAIAMPPDTLSARDRRLAAVHEAGHAVAALLSGEIVSSISIVTGDGMHGGVLTSPRAHMQRVSDFERGIVMMLAGRAAEEVLLGEVSGGASEDLAKSTRLVQRMIGELGLGTRLCVSTEVSVGEVEIRLRELYARALRLVTEHRAAVEALADLAIERRVLGRAALEEFAAAHGLGGGR